MAHNSSDHIAARLLLPRKRPLPDVESALIAPSKKRKIHPQAHLLGLPRELRDHIWEFALQEGPGRIAVNAHFRIPSLLSTNRQIRAETKPVFLYSNKFTVQVTDCDASRLRNFREFIDEYVDDEDDVDHTVLLNGNPNWKNLKAWCRAIWEGEDVDCFRHPDDTSHMAAIAGAATQIANESWYERSSWASCLHLLLQLRDVAGMLDPAWVADGMDEDRNEIGEEEKKAEEAQEAIARCNDYYIDEFAV